MPLRTLQVASYRGVTGGASLAYEIIPARLERRCFLFCADQDLRCRRASISQIQPTSLLQNLPVQSSQAIMTVSLEPQAVLSPLPKADGSATYSYAGYTITASTNGPIEVPRKDEDAYEAVVDVVVRPASGVGGESAAPIMFKHEGNRFCSPCMQAPERGILSRCWRAPCDNSSSSSISRAASSRLFYRSQRRPPTSMLTRNYSRPARYAFRTPSPAHTLPKAEQDSYETVLLTRFARTYPSFQLCFRPPSCPCFPPQSPCDRPRHQSPQQPSQLQVARPASLSTLHHARSSSRAQSTRSPLRPTESCSWRRARATSP